jgi:hypothetical protein
MQLTDIIFLALNSFCVHRATISNLSVKILVGEHLHENISLLQTRKDTINNRTKKETRTCILHCIERSFQSVVLMCGPLVTNSRRVIHVSIDRDNSR